MAMGTKCQISLLFSRVSSDKILRIYQKKAGPVRYDVGPGIKKNMLTRTTDLEFNKTYVLKTMVLIKKKNNPRNTDDLNSLALKDTSMMDSNIPSRDKYRSMNFFGKDNI